MTRTAPTSNAADPSATAVALAGVALFSAKPEQLAAFYSAGRRRRYATEGRVLQAPSDGAITVQRQVIKPLPGSETALRHRGTQEPFRAGTSLLDAIADADADSLSDVRQLA